MKTIKQSFLTIAIGLALVAGISYAWTGPTANPPLNNAPAPVNVSATGQYKTGALGIGGLFRAYSNAIVDGNVGIGTDAPKNRLHVKGSNWPAMFVDSTDAKGGFIGYGNNSKTGWATGMEPDGTWRLESYTGNGDWREAWSNGWVTTGTNVITANKNGNVGMGFGARADMPEATLHIATPNGDSDPWAFRMDQGAATGKVLTSYDNLGNAYWAEPKTGGGGSLSGYEVRTATGAGEIIVSCSSSKKILGGGCQAISTGNYVATPALTDSHPITTGQNGWRCATYMESIVAWAICAN